mmetsp:Transcript_7924/g.15493  ORF Transcript_7924/g.15493 Transcript_7924/m.15493 type:complete len:128 (-) Transcript_7924:181-564(-)
MMSGVPIPQLQSQKPAGDGLTEEMRILKNAWKESKLTCKICLKVFATGGSRARHMRTHENKRPYGCDVCGKRFRQNSHLKRHARLHTGEKPHMCLQCPQKFAQKSNLMVHVRAVHGGDPSASNPSGS